MGRRQRRMQHHLSSLRSQRGQTALLITYTGSGLCKRERSSGKMTADDVGAVDWMQPLQEAFSLDIV
jgi:hypothetical protein